MASRGGKQELTEGGLTRPDFSLSSGRGRRLNNWCMCALNLAGIQVGLQVNVEVCLFVFMRNKCPLLNHRQPPGITESDFIPTEYLQERFPFHEQFTSLIRSNGG